MKSLKQLEVAHKTVFVRVDFNVPVNNEGHIVEDARIRAALNTIEYLVQEGAKVVLASHMGRPKGQVVEKLRMRPVATRLSELIGQPVQYVEDCIGEAVEAAKVAMQPGDVLLLENVRFHEAEKKNNEEFAAELAKGIDVYVQEAFGAIHRKHATTFALPGMITEKGHGFLIGEELAALGKVKNNPEQPLVVLVGGMKVSDKVDVIRNLAPLGDCVLIGGGVANAFMKGLDVPVASSLVESDSVAEGQESIDYSQVARSIYDQFVSEESSIAVTMPDGSPLKKIVVPLDFIAAPSLDTPVGECVTVTVGENEIPEGYMFLDIGPKTRELYAQVLGHAKTVFWNGPMGVFEKAPFEAGSKDVATVIAESSAFAVLGGGDTESVVETFGLGGRYAHVSTGGGASLTFLADEELPGLDALE